MTCSQHAYNMVQYRPKAIKAVISVHIGLEGEIFDQYILWGYCEKVKFNLEIKRKVGFPEIYMKGWYIQEEDIDTWRQIHTYIHICMDVYVYVHTHTHVALHVLCQISLSEYSRTKGSTDPANTVPGRGKDLRISFLNLQNMGKMDNHQRQYPIRLVR